MSCVGQCSYSYYDADTCISLERSNFPKIICGRDAVGLCHTTHHGRHLSLQDRCWSCCVPPLPTNHTPSKTWSRKLLQSPASMMTTAMLVTMRCDLKVITSNELFTHSVHETFFRNHAKTTDFHKGMCSHRNRLGLAM